MWGKKHKKFIVSTIIFIAATLSVSAVSVPKQVINAKKSVVRVISHLADGVGSGTGFAISKNGLYVVTNHHVIENSTKILIYGNTPDPITATIAVDAPEKDLCVLKLDRPLVNAKPLPVATGKIESGDYVYALGFPGVADNMSSEMLSSFEYVSITDGLISAIRTSHFTGEPALTVQTNAAINSGNSGGPLLNSKGQVVAINTFGMNDAEGVNGSMHVNELVTILKANNIPFEKSSSLPIIFTILTAITLVLLVGFLVVKFVKNGLDIKSKANKLSEFKGRKTSRTPQKTAMILQSLIVELQNIPDAKLQSKLLTEDNILIEESKARLKRTKITKGVDISAIYTGEFSAPEAYTGIENETSVVYMLGKILNILLQQNIYLPQTDTQRGEQAEPQIDTTYGLADFALKMTEQSQQNRIPNLQDCKTELQKIIDQMPREIKSVDELQVKNSFRGIGVKKPLTGKKVCVMVVAGVAVIGIAFGGFSVYMSRKISDEWNMQNYSAVKEMYDTLPWLKANKEDVYNYACGKVAISDLEIEKARDIFTDLGDYIDSEAIAKKCRLYLLADVSTTTVSKYDSFISLGNFADSAKKARSMLPTVYQEAIRTFNYLTDSTYLDDAKKIFESLPQDYENVIPYILACNTMKTLKKDMIKVRDFNEAFVTLSVLEELIELDTQMMGTGTINYYLHGDWYETNGYGSFYYDIHSNIFEFSDIYLPNNSFDFTRFGLTNLKTGTLQLAWEYVDINTLKVIDNSTGYRYVFAREKPYYFED